MQAILPRPPPPCACRNSDEWEAYSGHGGYKEAVMGLFDQIVSSALRGGLGEADQSALPGLLGQLLGQTNLGNVGGLLQQLQQGGLGGQVASWLGNGQNLPVSTDQLQA